MLSTKAQAMKESLNKSKRNQDKALNDILAVSRNVVPLLRDKGLPSVADELERHIYVYDCEIQEGVKLLQADGGIEAMLELLTGGKGKEGIG